MTIRRVAGVVCIVAGWALAVQLADDTWVESNRASTVYCGCGTGGGWLYHEGTGFSQKSPPVKLTLPVRP